MNTINQRLLSIVLLIGILMGLQHVYRASYEIRAYDTQAGGTVVYIKENMWTGTKCIPERNGRNAFYEGLTELQSSECKSYGLLATWLDS